MRRSSVFAASSICLGDAMNRIKTIVLISLIVLLFLIGACIFFYPALSSYLNQKNSSRVIADYTELANELDEIEIEAELESAKNYNDDLFEHMIVLTDPLDPDAYPITEEEYMEVLNLNEVMAYVEIPCIDVYLPVYHGTEKETLEKGVGHMENTSVPVGGANTHTVLSAHCGLPTARLFTDLVQVQKGNIFRIHVLNQTLSYQVYDIEVTLPDNCDSLYISPNEDLATLITCTPYGENTHRLLVHGRRITEEKAEEIIKHKQEVKASAGFPWEIVATAAACVLMVLFIVTLVLVVIVMRKRNRNK